MNGFEIIVVKLVRTRDIAKVRQCAAWEAACASCSPELPFPVPGRMATGVNWRNVTYLKVVGYNLQKAVPWFDIPGKNGSVGLGNGGFT